MSIRQGKWTSQPNDDQIRREANKEYWNFICPKCGGGWPGGTWKGDMKRRYEALSRGGHKFPHVNHIFCMCGWKWYDPEYYTPDGMFQAKLEEFTE